MDLFILSHYLVGGRLVHHSTLNELYFYISVRLGLLDAVLTYIASGRKADTLNPLNLASRSVLYQKL